MHTLEISRIIEINRGKTKQKQNPWKSKSTWHKTEEETQTNKIPSECFIFSGNQTFKGIRIDVLIQ